MSFLQRQEYHARLQKETQRVYAKMVHDVEKQHRELVERPRWASYPPKATVQMQEPLQAIQEPTRSSSSSFLQPTASRPNSRSSTVSAPAPSYSKLELSPEINPDDRNFFTNSYAKYYPLSGSVSAVEDDEDSSLQSRAPRKGRWLVFGAEKPPEYSTMPQMHPATVPPSVTTPASGLQNTTPQVTKFTLNFAPSDAPHSMPQVSVPATSRSAIAGKKLTTANPLSARPRRASPPQLSLFERKGMRYSLPQTVIPGILEEKKKREAQLHVRKHKGAFYHHVPLKKIDD